MESIDSITCHAYPVSTPDLPDTDHLQLFLDTLFTGLSVPIVVWRCDVMQQLLDVMSCDRNPTFSRVDDAVTRCDMFVLFQINIFYHPHDNCIVINKEYYVFNLISVPQLKCQLVITNLCSGDL